MGKPLSFSVGIPTFNQGEYLEEAILSLLDQTRPPDEIFISDHFSTGQGEAMLAGFAAGERIAPKGRLGAAIKRILRPYAQKLNASLHRG